MESIDTMTNEIDKTKTPPNPDSALVGELLGKVAELQSTIVEVVELVSKIQIAETKEEETPAEEEEPAPVEEKE